MNATPAIKRPEAKVLQTKYSIFAYFDAQDIKEPTEQNLNVFNIDQGLNLENDDETVFEEDITFGEISGKEYFEDKVIEFEDVETVLVENGDANNDNIFGRSLAAKEFIYHNELGNKPQINQQTYNLVHQFMGENQNAELTRQVVSEINNYEDNIALSLKK